MGQLIIKIKSIKWKSLREMEDLIVPINSLNGINLLQIQNGYGKTTTLELLRHIFTGKLPDKKVWSSYKYKQQFGGDRSKSEFWVDLEIDEADYQIGIEFNHIQNVADFITISPEIGGRERGWRPPQNFKSKFENKPELVKLFIFNGEMADQLNRAQGATIIEDAIRQVTNLDKLYDLIRVGKTKVDKGQLQEIIESHLSKQSIQNASNAYAKNQGYHQECIDHIIETEKWRDEQKSEIDEYEKRKQQIQKELDQMDKTQEEYFPRIQKALEKQTDAQNKVNRLTEELLDSIFNPANLHIDTWENVKGFHATLEKEKIPRTVGEQFIVELMDNIKCLCGTPWTKEMKIYTKEHMKKYLGNELLTCIKAMQSEVRESENNDDIELLSQYISNSLDDVMKHKQEISNIRKLFDEDIAVKQKELSKELGTIIEKINQIQPLIEQIEEEDVNTIIMNGWDKDVRKRDGNFVVLPTKFRDCINLKMLEKLEAHIRNRLSELAGVKNLNRGVEITSLIVRNVLNTLMEKLRKIVITNANTIMEKMHATGGGGVKLKSLNSGLKFTDYFGEEQDNVNMAAQLAGAYSYVTAMYMLGEIEVPLIIDSPVTGFGIGVAQNWAKEIPDKFPQVVAFITSMEKVGLIEIVSEDNVNTEVVTIRRENEGIEGLPQSGKMICDMDDNFFENYEIQKVRKILLRTGGIIG